MSIRVVHLVDDHTPEDGARLCSLVLRKLPAEDVAQQVVAMGEVPASLVVPGDRRAVRAARPLTWPMVWAQPLQRRLRQLRPDAVFAWSAVACAAAGSAGGFPVVGVVCDPSDAQAWSRWSDAVRGGSARRFELACTSGTVQRRLVECGVPMGSTVVIRPGIDFAAIRRARQTADRTRSRLGLPAAGRVMLTASPPSRVGGQYHAVWATAILHHIWPDAMLIVPGVSREQRRIARLIESIYCPQVYRLTGDVYSPTELLAVADALVVPALGDVSSGWIAWAMAAGVPIVGSAVPAVAEFIADRQNGFLCKPGEPHTLAIRIRTVFESPELLAQCARTAGQQAYETFRAERCVDEFLKLLRNLVAGGPALAGVRDAAFDA
ncbi:MAG: glycosyltransferase [Planctomycetes bacterium]|nr:glycosyltransferase [Planctomycetota bacterium]